LIVLVEPSIGPDLDRAIALGERISAAKPRRQVADDEPTAFPAKLKTEVLHHLAAGAALRWPSQLPAGGRWAALAPAARAPTTSQNEIRPIKLSLEPELGAGCHMVKTRRRQNQFLAASSLLGLLLSGLLISHKVPHGGWML